MTSSKNGRNDDWEQKWQARQPMSAWYKAHRAKKPHMSKIWYMFETCRNIPSAKVLATMCDTTESAVDHVLQDFREAGGKLERQGNGRGYSVTMPKVKKLAPVTMPQLELVATEPQVPEQEPLPQRTLDDVYDKLSELVDLVRTWS